MMPLLYFDAINENFSLKPAQITIAEPEINSSTIGLYDSSKPIHRIALLSIMSKSTVSHSPHIQLDKIYEKVVFTLH